ncbi:hypothetical protein BpHYR1_037628 [Brachionus plicatilis]|uniref:Uncharacterized protein n=1 Tax=Brachionus plicatilis TaxID=10195 RepID=A0A3M7RYP0_BRAPC|nr:hypothetical protein BpHYR1_037628 [Brachionus plicatilis]
MKNGRLFRILELRFKRYFLYKFFGSSEAKKILLKFKSVVPAIKSNQCETVLKKVLADNQMLNFFFKLQLEFLLPDQWLLAANSCLLF